MSQQQKIALKIYFQDYDIQIKISKDAEMIGIIQLLIENEYLDDKSIKAQDLKSYYYTDQKLGDQIQIKTKTVEDILPQDQRQIFIKLIPNQDQQQQKMQKVQQKQEIMQIIKHIDRTPLNTQSDLLYQNNPCHRHPSSILPADDDDEQKNNDQFIKLKEQLEDVNKQIQVFIQTYLPDLKQKNVFQKNNNIITNIQKLLNQFANSILKQSVTKSEWESKIEQLQRAKRDMQKKLRQKDKQIELLKQNLQCKSEKMVNLQQFYEKNNPNNTLTQYSLLTTSLFRQQNHQICIKLQEALEKEIKSQIKEIESILNLSDKKLSKELLINIFNQFYNEQNILVNIAFQQQIIGFFSRYFLNKSKAYISNQTANLVIHLKPEMKVERNFDNKIVYVSPYSLNFEGQKYQIKEDSSENIAKLFIKNDSTSGKTLKSIEMFKIYFEGDK